MASDDEQNGNLKSSDGTVHDKEHRKSLSMARAMDNETVLRSPVGRKQNYDDEINESLRILKERKTGTSLASVPDESNSRSVMDQDQDQDQNQATTSNHSSVPSMPQTRVVRKRRLEIVPHSMTPVKTLRSDTILSQAHICPDEPDATDNEDTTTTNHSIKQPIFPKPTGFIRKSRRSEINSHLLKPVESMRSNTILARSPNNMDVIQHKTKQPDGSHSDDEVVHKHRLRSSHTPKPSDDKCLLESGRTRIPTRSDQEQTSIAGRPRRSQTPVDYKAFFLSAKEKK